MIFAMDDLSTSHHDHNTFTPPTNLSQAQNRKLQQMSLYFGTNKRKNALSWRKEKANSNIKVEIP